MDDQCFADGIGAISVFGTTVRLDFITLSPTERDKSGKPKAVFQNRVVMSLEGFVHSAEKIQEAAQAIAKIAAKQESKGPNLTSGRVDAGKDKKQSNSGGKSIGAGPGSEDSKPPFP